MNFKTINQETIENILKSDDIDMHTAKVLEQAKACVEFINGLNLDIYNVDSSSSMRQIVDYRIGTLEKSGRTFYGAKECTLKLEKFAPDHPVSWIAKKVKNNILVLIIDRKFNSVIHAMSTVTKST
ncbi:hypothetical protein [Pseudomonas syringae]|uniref:hypothetical protein n=1 Tax=Pseudomonas syringae TaxID=317 RepID=UPI000CD29641|nr:hypothetical protein [Pseudomonas syringae]MBI6748670.1 hypothetical protein [Pseudomonas syringae]MBI6825702.1 hypothetical protein [Pseudomonas syringae]MCF4987609.1 hypothetical protein [Pseudomonas syringae]MCF5206236.1 hypothetical protein [Pseudomonas syringae]MCF5273809.1 hypothetical protein [Pseudomonas syringae]